MDSKFCKSQFEILSKKFDSEMKVFNFRGQRNLFRLPKYLTNFTDGDLSVDDAILMFKYSFFRTLFRFIIIH